MEEIESSINRYFTELDTADRQEPSAAQAKIERLQDKIAALKAQMKALKDIEVQLNQTPDKQISLTDIEFRFPKAAVRHCTQPTHKPKKISQTLPYTVNSLN
jgi:hypothetical protein